MARDYNFWVYIVTNVHDSVLHIGMTNDLARRVSGHCSCEMASFASAYRFRKLIYNEHYTEVQDENPEVRASLKELIEQARRRREPAYLFVNNRLEGNTPTTIMSVISDSD